ncbi:MAG: hypothetical protein J2P15_14525 [Micromonosporaceae bacterium]|nr:hypothetical protein [Micromonosporaceae bacterium]
MRGSAKIPGQARIRSLVAAVLAGTLMALTAPLAARAAPSSGDDGDPALQQKLAAASQAYNDAKGRLLVAKQRQADLELQAQETATQLTEISTQVSAMAVQEYKGGRLAGVSVLLDSSNATDFLDRATTLYQQAAQDNRLLEQAHAFQAQYDQQHAAIANEVAYQQNQLAVMAKRKQDAEKALTAANSGTTSGPGGNLVATATPAPRNPDGSWPPETCSVNDPTTSGCITPRMLHAYQQARAAGFTRYTSCYRSGGSGEHPKGRACDFSAHSNTFLNAVATGDDKAYGDRLAAWLIANSDRLAVLYIIWFKRIWLPSTGWRTYTAGDGTPAGDHYNHVHLSVQ